MVEMVTVMVTVVIMAVVVVLAALFTYRIAIRQASRIVGAKPTDLSTQNQHVHSIRFEFVPLLQHGLAFKQGDSAPSHVIVHGSEVCFLVILFHGIAVELS